MSRTIRFHITLALLATLAAPLGLAQAYYDQTGEHVGEVNSLKYHIEYLNPLGVTTADATGITYDSIFGTNHETTLLPDTYWGDYPLYFSGGTLHYRIHLSNSSGRSFHHIKVFAWQEFLNIDGHAGEPMHETPESWYIETLRGNETIVLEGTFTIPFSGSSGIDQTHLQILHWAPGGVDPVGSGRVIVDDPQAGLWCPTA